MTVLVPRDTDLHDLFCDAFLDWGGYLTIDGTLYELLGATHVEDADAFAWWARPATYAGTASACATWA
jgi:hypothetical protein